MNAKNVGQGHHIQGDLIEMAKAGQFDVIVQHGCNCFCTMGAGIARQIRAHFPQAWEADQDTVCGDRDKLGTYSSATVTLDNGKPLVVVNAYTQYDYKPDRPQLDMQALTDVFARIAQDFPHAHIAYPAIGAGLAGGQWAEIHPAIEQALADHEHTYVEFVPN